MQWESFGKWIHALFAGTSNLKGSIRDQRWAQIQAIQSILKKGSEIITRLMQERNSYGSHFPLSLIAHMSKFLPVLDSILLSRICRAWNLFSITKRGKPRKLGRLPLCDMKFLPRPFAQQGRITLMLIIFLFRF